MSRSKQLYYLINHEWTMIIKPVFLITRAVVMQKGRIIADQAIELLQETGEKLVPFLHRTCGYDETGALALLEQLWEYQSFTCSGCSVAARPHRA